MIYPTRVLLVVFLLLSCSHKDGRDCPIDTEFKDRFLNCIHIAESTIERHGVQPSVQEKITLSDVMQSINCLEAITKHKNHMKFENDLMFAVYETEEDLDGDVKIWLGWYEKNKCGYGMDSAEIAFRGIREKFPNYKSLSAIDSLGKIWMEYKGDSIKIKDSLFHVSMGAYWPTVKVKQ
jgi:hypothetical protein